MVILNNLRNIDCKKCKILNNLGEAPVFVE